MPATFLSLGWAGARHPSYAELARATPQQHGMVLGWCQEHLGPPPRAAPASAPQWRLSPLGGGCRMRACMQNTKFSLSHILDAYFKVGEFVIASEG